GGRRDASGRNRRRKEVARGMSLVGRILSIIAALLLSANGAPSEQSTPPPGAASSYLVYVGTYTDKTASKGIYAYRYDPVSGKLSELGLAAETANPSWLVVHPNAQFLYAVNESGKNSTVSAFRIDAATGKLTLLNQVSAEGEDPCYISLDHTGKWVLVANYTSGNVIVFRVGADGKLGFAAANVHNEGKVGPATQQQDGAHAHWVRTSKDNRTAYVADLALDQIIPYEFDDKEGTLTLRTRALSETLGSSYAVPLPPGTGPRHAVFSPDGSVLYVLGELKSTMSAVSTAGPLTPVDTRTQEQHISTLPAKFSGRNDAAEIAIDASGKHLYASNRGHESIAVFSIDKKNRK